MLAAWLPPGRVSVALGDIIINRLQEISAPLSAGGVRDGWSGVRMMDVEGVAIQDVLLCICFQIHKWPCAVRMPLVFA